MEELKENLNKETRKAFIALIILASGLILVSYWVGYYLGY